MIYITGDCHGDWRRFSSKNFPDQREMTRDDFVIVCGDFGIWDRSKSEEWNLNWLASKPFTVLFVDGNHENFDRLNSDFEIVDFHGGKAHKIRENVYHLMRGYVFELCGKKFFAFGGARSHDISDGILRIENFDSWRDLWREYDSRPYDMIRVEHVSWWEEEMPTMEEMERGMESLKRVGFKVDYVITHCCPPQVLAMMFGGNSSEENDLIRYHGLVSNTVEFDKWYFGHYHDNKEFLDKYVLLYEKIERIV